MPNKTRPNPSIPDHEVLRKIGGGAYGEVWMARGVTGALRAIKVVWREDFDDTRGFEREFEGILKFEPMSRDHPGLVHILHVGRSPDGVSFYYYVMELGDDVRSGQDINPIEYEPRTLRADNKAGVQWETGLCIDVGLRLAEALDHLHERGLAHRDVKPSNIIFVNGRAKLADIGLVAARDQRTFVGTEGFVPPEGPGSAQADVYSLGKVLYEIATGKDRMDFPELPDDLPAGGDRKRWLELNKIVCDICEPRISKRKISKASDLADSLRLLQRGKRRRRSGTAVWLTTLMLTGFAGWAVWENVKDSEWLLAMTRVPSVLAPRIGKVRITSSPEGAEVCDASGNAMGITTPGTMEARVGDEIVLTVRKPGYRPLAIREKVPPSATSEPFVVGGAMRIFSPPRTGEPWEDHLGNLYQPAGGDHIGSGYVKRQDWLQFLESSKRSEKASEFIKVSQNGRPEEVVLSSAEEAVAYCDWLRVGGNKAGFLTEDHEAVPLSEKTFVDPGLSERARNEGLSPFRVMVREISYGSLKVVSNPPRAKVFMNGIDKGSTDGTLLIPKVKPGSVELYFVLEGYKPLPLDVKVDPGKTLPVSVTLEENQGVVFGKPWRNGIGMRFVPIGSDLMASVWETRVRDYALFMKETRRPAARVPDFTQNLDHPAVYISRDDAVAFCEWLTKREQKDERIATSHVYRLPTDMEWSRMAGLEEEIGPSPGWRDARKSRVFPWGDWPPSQGAGNFADATAALAPGMSTDRAITEYDDGYTQTAPVGTFVQNANGLHDLGGNVQEWVSDDYSRTSTGLGVLRGGGWNSYQQENLYTGFRNAVPSNVQDAIYGFRVVLAKVPVEDETPAPETPASDG